MEQESFVYTGNELETMSYAVNYNQWILKIFKSYISGNVVEVGAGQGSLSKLFLPYAKRFVAIEPDENNCRTLSEKFKGEDKIKIYNGFLSETKLPFDVVNTVLYINVLEHIEDDHKEMKMVSDLIGKDGYICVFVPAIKKLYGDVDKQVGHFRRYSKSELITLFEKKLKMKIQTIGYFDFAGVLPWYLSTCVLKSNNVSTKNVRLYDKLVVPIMSRVESIFPMPLGKNLYIVARNQ